MKKAILVAAAVSSLIAAEEIAESFDNCCFAA